MNVKDFDGFIVRPAANGVIVYPDRGKNMTFTASEIYVFTGFDKLVEWMDKRVIKQSD
jgi:hypothetical protein